MTPGVRGPRKGCLILLIAVLASCVGGESPRHRLLAGLVGLLAFPVLAFIQNVITVAACLSGRESYEALGRMPALQRAIREAGVGRAGVCWLRCRDGGVEYGVLLPRRVRGVNQLGGDLAGRLRVPWVRWQQRYPYAAWVQISALEPVDLELSPRLAARDFPAMLGLASSSGQPLSVSLADGNLEVVGASLHARANAVHLLLAGARKMGFELAGWDSAGVTLSRAAEWPRIIVGKTGPAQLAVRLGELYAELTHRQMIGLLTGAGAWSPLLGPRLLVVFVEVDEAEVVGLPRSQLLALLADGPDVGITVVVVVAEADRVSFSRGVTNRLVTGADDTAQARLVAPTSRSEGTAFQAFDSRRLPLGVA